MEDFIFDACAYRLRGSINKGENKLAFAHFPTSDSTRLFPSPTLKDFVILKRLVKKARDNVTDRISPYEYWTDY